MIHDNSSTLDEQHVSVDSFGKEHTNDDDNDIVYPVLTDLPILSSLDEYIYDEDILYPVSNNLPMLSRSLSYEKVLTTFYNPEQLEQQTGLWCNSSPRDDIEMLSEEMTYMNTST